MQMSGEDDLLIYEYNFKHFWQRIRYERIEWFFSYQTIIYSIN